MTKHADDRVTIRWYAVPNANTRQGGWMPVYDLNGKMRGDTYGKGHPLETALKMARADAEDEGARYVGDWAVTVEPKPGAPGVPKSRTRAAAPKRAPPSPWGQTGTSADTLPWRNSYANWTIRAGEAAARHGAHIAFGADTHAAWEAGISPDEFARKHSRRA